jgi:hypothetical protein
LCTSCCAGVSKRRATDATTDLVNSRKQPVNENFNMKLLLFSIQLCPWFAEVLIVAHIIAACCFC